MSNASPRSIYLAIFCGSMIVLLCFGVRQTFGLFVNPISEELEWSKGVFSLSIAFQTLLWGVMQPFAGGIADRYGSARVIFAGAVLYIIGLLIMANATTPGMMHIANGIFMGTALSGTAFGVVLAALARAVPEHHRSMALGIGTAAGSGGQFLIVPLGQFLLNRFGWSQTIMILAAMLLIVLPMTLALRGVAENVGPKQSLRESLSEASARPGFWLLTSGFFVCGFHVSFIGTHMPGYLEFEGLGKDIGALSLAVIGLFNLFGALSAGWLGGRYSKKYLLSTIYMLRAIVMAMFLFVPVNTTTVFVFSAAIGLLWLSTVPLTSGLVGQIFGVRYMGMLFGIVFFGHQVGGFLGSWLGGEFFERTGSYDLMWWIGVALGVASALVHWPIDERPIERLDPAAS